jgi:hypothetical protein
MFAPVDPGDDPGIDPGVDPGGDPARARLAAAGSRARPVTLARDRTVAVPGDLGALLPGGALRRGVVVTVEGHPGAGVTTLALDLAAAVTAIGEWAAAVDLDGTLGGEAVAEAGVILERFAVIRPGARGVTAARWAGVVAALLDGVSLVVAEVPRHVSTGDARRLVARARERETVLVAVESGARWPADAALCLHAAGGAWRGLVPGAGLLSGRSRTVRVEGRGEAARPRTGVLARAV